MKNSTRGALAFGLGLALLASAWLGGAPGAARAADERALVLLPLVPNEARAPRPVDAHVVVYLPRAEAAARLERLRVRADGIVLHEEALTAELAGDPLLGTVQALLERLPHHVTELHRERRYFADPAAPEFVGAEVAERVQELQGRVQELRAQLARAAHPSFVELSFPLALDQLFFTDDPPGTLREVALEVDWRGADGALRTAAVAEEVKLLPRPLGVPPTLVESVGAATIHAGDLHVHSCHGEAANACAPSTDCAAESFQTTGSFTYAELKTQYQALGIDWFTATDHSYCINSAAEYATIAAETAAVSDASFLVAPDIELSSDEAGPQIGGDSANLLCLFGEPQNHMGAHGISQRIPGGSDGFLGFCDGLTSDALASFLTNIATVRGQGGWPIANHPTAGSFAWNSFAATLGIEADALHGVEVWNGAFVSGQGGDVGRWVDWLLDGRVLYAYSGSDTHDEAFAFGANHAVLLGGAPFTPANLDAALRNGRSFISNGPVATVEVELGGQLAFMGARYALPSSPPAAPLAARVHYDVGASPCTITIFRGRVGDAAEAVLCQSALVTGAGSLECADTVTTGGRSWYRAYVESQDGTQAAYTNPVFLEPGAEDPQVYCAAKPNSQGCVPQIAFAGTPSATSPQPFTLSVSEVLAAQNGILFYGGAPALIPFQDGTLCVQPPIVRTPIQNAGGAPPCGGVYALDFNAWIQSGVDPGLTAGTTVYAQFWSRDPLAPSTTGLSDAVEFTILP